MAQRVVMVTKAGSRGGAEQVVIDGTGDWSNAGVAAILALPAEIQSKHGAGQYRFIVQDASGPERAEWVVRLGNEAPMTASAFGATSENVPSAVTGLIPMGFGAFFNEQLGIITTRDGRMFPWRSGDPLPSVLIGGAGAAAASTPISAGQIPAIGGFTDDHRVRELEARLQDADRKREAQEIRDTFARLTEDTNKRFETLVEKMAAKPAGPDPAVQALQARLDAAERENRDRDRDTALRAEMRAQQDKTEALIRAVQESKTDPMMPLLGQIITSMQTNVSAQANATKEIAELITDKFAGSMLTPDRMMEVIRMAKDRGADAEVMKNGLEMYKQLFGMSQDVLKLQAELSQDNTPWWAGAIQETAGKLSGALNVYAQGKARADMAAAQRPMPQQQQRPPQRPMPQQRPPQAVPQPGRTVGQQAARTMPTPVQAPTNGKSRMAVVPPAAVPSAAVPPPAAAPAARRGRPPRAATPPGAPAMPAANHPLNVAPEADIREVMKEFGDPELFGSLFDAIAPVRASAAGGTDPMLIAVEVYGAKSYYEQSGETATPAYELLAFGHLDILMERLLPDAPDDYRAAVVAAVRAKLEGAEAEEEGEEAEEEGDGGEEATA